MERITFTACVCVSFKSPIFNRLMREQWRKGNSGRTTMFDLIEAKNDHWHEVNPFILHFLVFFFI